MNVLLQINFFDDGVYILGGSEPAVAHVSMYALFAATNDAMLLGDVVYYSTADRPNWTGKAISYLKINKANPGHEEILWNFRTNLTLWAQSQFKGKANLYFHTGEEIDFEAALFDAKHNHEARG